MHSDILKTLRHQGVKAATSMPTSTFFNILRLFLQRVHQGNMDINAQKLAIVSINHVIL